MARALRRRRRRRGPGSARRRAPCRRRAPRPRPPARRRRRRRRRSTCLARRSRSRRRRRRARKKGEKKNETEKEKLRARRRSLQSKLDLEQHYRLAARRRRRRDDVRASRGRLVVCARRGCPTAIERNDDGRLRHARRARGSRRTSTSRARDVTWVSCPGGDEEIGDDEKEGLAAELREVGCVPVYVDPGLLAERRGDLGRRCARPLFHYIPLSMLDCDWIDVITSGGPPTRRSTPRTRGRWPGAEDDGGRPGVVSSTFS